MITAAVLACVALDLREFFPMAQGTRWTYETSVDERVVEGSTTVAGAPVTIGGELAVPFATSVQGRVTGTVFHRATEDAVLIVAFNAKRPLDIPRPLLKFSEGGSKWEIQTDEGGEALVMRNLTSFKTAQPILGGVADVVELKVDATLGEKARAIQFNQTATYARGMGLVEMVTEQREGRKVFRKRVKLVQFKAAEGGV